MESPLPTAAIKQDFSRRLSNAMRDKGWNQAELAEHASKYTKNGKLGRYSISLYVKGKTLPRPQQLNAIARALGVKAEELMPVPQSSLANANSRFEMKDIGEGKAWLRVNQAVDWSTAVEVAKLLKANTQC